MEEGTIFKVIVAGEGAVGKTTLLHRYVNGQFIENTPMTIGLQFFTKVLNLNNKSYKVVFWDVGGQEQFRELHRSFIGGSMGSILMFDMSRLSSLNNIQKWLEILRFDDENVPILLVGSKYDLILNNENINIASINQYAVDIKEKYNLFDYCITSSRIGYNIDIAFSMLLEKVKNHFALKSILNKFMPSNSQISEI